MFLNSETTSHALAPTAQVVQVKNHTLSIKIAHKPYIIGSLGPKALKYESFDAKGYYIGGLPSELG